MCMCVCVLCVCVCEHEYRYVYTRVCMRVWVFFVGVCAHVHSVGHLLTILYTHTLTGGGEWVNEAWVWLIILSTCVSVVYVCVVCVLRRGMRTTGQERPKTV